MKIEAVGSFLPDEILIDARKKYSKGLLDKNDLTAIEDCAVRKIVERQIASGLPYVTSGELRCNHWANDFWFGLSGISCKNITSGHIYQPIEAATDLLHINGRIEYNTDHPVFQDFAFLHDAVKGRALCRQALPSPANLLLEIISLSDGRPEQLYGSVESLVEDIAEAYRLTIQHLYDMGCASVLFDDTACGLMCDDNFTKRLLQGGVDLINLHKLIIDVINASVKDVPGDMERAIYLSAGDDIVPEWEFICFPDNIMPTVLKCLNVDKFFLPFEIGNEYSLEILRHIPDEKKVVLGLMEAHSPFSDDICAISSTIRKAERYIKPESLYVSPKTGFKLSTYTTRGLTEEDQWRKLSELAAISKA